MSSTPSPPSSDPPIPSDDAPTPRPSGEFPTDFREQTLQSVKTADVTQERPSFVLPAAEARPSSLERSEAPTDRDRLDAFVAVAAASADRMARTQETFLNRFGAMLEDDGDDEAARPAAIDTPETKGTTGAPDPLRSIARDVCIIALLVACLLAVAAWSAGRQSIAPPAPIVVTPAAP